MNVQTIQIGDASFRIVKRAGQIKAVRPPPSLVEALGDLGVAGVQRERDVLHVTLGEERMTDGAMAELRRLGVVHHSYEIVTDEDVPLHLRSFIPNDVIHVAAHADGDYERFAERYALVMQPAVAAQFRSFRLTDATPCNPIKLSAWIAEKERVRFVEPDFFQVISPSSPAHQWHLYSVANAPLVDARAGIGADLAWQITRGDAEVTVAVLDDGFDLAHPDLSGGIVSPADFSHLKPGGDSVLVLPGDEDPSAVAAAGDYHGTPCAALAIARSARWVSGVAPGCSFMPVRIALGLSSQEALLHAFRYAARHADVVSCSWNVTPTAWSAPSSAQLALFSELLTTGGRRGKGLVVCFATGNWNLPTHLAGSENSEGLEYYDAGAVTGHIFKNQTIRGGWSEIPGVIVVGAVTGRRRKALYSGWGPHLSVVAPSDNYHPIDPRTRSRYADAALTTATNHTVGLDLDDVGLAPEPEQAVTRYMGGSSGATPLVAGACALVLSANDQLDAAGVKRIIEVTASKNLELTLDEPDMFNNRGQDGRFNATTGHSAWFGHGKIDVGRAVRRALEELTPTLESETSCPLVPAQEMPPTSPPVARRE